MKVRGLIPSMIALAAGCTAEAIEAEDPGAGYRVERIEAADDGQPYFVGGELGKAAARIADPTGAPDALARVLPAIADTLRVPAADLVATRVQRDALGMTHVRLAQRKNGLRVVGGDVVLHLGADDTVRAVTSTARDRELDAAPAIDAAEAARIAIEATAGGDADAKRSELTYVIATGDGELYLAWEIEVVGRSELVMDRVYVDALTGRVVDRRPQVFTARNRAIYDGQGKSLADITTPPRIGTEASPPTGDPVAIAAFANTGATYDCYQALFQRDSYDGVGSPLESVVHVLFPVPGGTSGNNAAWIGGADVMVYGDGDGVTMRPLAYGFDVTTHELTHAVTAATANLAYQNESGALNEGMSDIMAAVCEVWRDKAITADAWLVGEDIYTPAVAGDALRYMANPTRDTVSRDYYPERFTDPQQDNGGVHLNSGIPNLAFYLLVTGGTHPRNKTAVGVPGIGIEKAGAIFQRALTKGYFTANTNMAQARTATEQVAQELYPGCTKLSVATAWAAVGVGAAPVDGPPTVEITSPANGARVAAGFQVEVNAADDQCITKVELSVDGTVVGTATEPPYSFPTDAGLAPGGHTLQVTTFDASKQATATAIVTVIGEDSGCGCTTGGRRGAAGTLALVLATAFALGRRRPRR